MLNLSAFEPGNWHYLNAYHNHIKMIIKKESSSNDYWIDTYTERKTAALHFHMKSVPQK